jgi:general secretion pathway protein G
MERARRNRAAAGGEGGFTLIELLIVVAIIGIIAGIAVAQLRQTPQKAKEAVLKEDLYVLRDVIDQYFADKGKYPESLGTLVEEGYIRKIPVDPFTGSDQTWEEVQAESGEEDPDAEGGVIDVHSGATGAALDGSRYSEW